MARKDAQQGSAEKKPGRIAQIKSTYRMARRSDRWIGWVTLAAILVTLGVFVALGFILDRRILYPLMGLPMALLVGALIFGRRAERAAYAQIEGQPGAAMAALGTLRRGWDTTPVVATNKHQDVVHRAVGKPGIILVAEGTSHQRLSNLLGQEKRRHARVSPETPIHEIIVGRGEDEIPLPKLARQVRKLPRQLRGAEITELRSRLRALGTQPVPMPKGPLPKGLKIPRGGMPQQR
ncbi:MAG TPA: DUF4191 domain-containing protein [Jiangellaceae bacterium]|nr:DUF4191 domain-containing protein [Jiangellaceae bacterium]